LTPGASYAAKKTSGEMWVCYACAQRSEIFRRTCPACGAIDCAIEAAGAVDVAPADVRAALAGAVRASTITAPDPPHLSTGLPIWDACLSGGPAAGSSLLVAGPPGVGKTTGALFAAAHIAAAVGRDALIVSAEMSAALCVATARRAGADLSRLLIVDGAAVEPACETVARVRPSCVIWDSVQALTFGAMRGDAAAAQAVYAARRASSRAGAVAVFVCQLNKAGTPAGRAANLYETDATLLISRRRARCTKNRFGPAPITVKLGADSPGRSRHTRQDRRPE
jgi:predicted ATP-dependent serine protease